MSNPLQLLAACVRFSCSFPIASTSAPAPRLRPLQLLLPDFASIHFNCSLLASASAAASRLRLLQLLLPDCVRFSCCSPIASTSAAAPRLRLLQLLLPDFASICFNCCSPFVSTSAAARCLRPLQLLLPDCVRISCCSPIACNPAVLEDSSPCLGPMFSNTLHGI